MDIVQEFTDWLKTKPEDAMFDFESSSNCCFAQFLKETGKAKSPVCGIETWAESNMHWDWKKIPPAIIAVLQPSSKTYRGTDYQSFGSVLRKLEANG